ncbi:hybrid sensor histidine kinase/response regulator [Desulfomonile tiedjei]|uniref:histidine kinase n=1 Tax=Desulfomonile tiedjei (strain ATCC 49306 / DSM 6799 / DCB-1) TaxID=706587 RepID=I4C694_DESTA|nr:hybrid sensor histidine kinase/response regulator [Desulfomonile tiedjei]AFM25085.1 histidine kinase,Response regulator receiver domain protein,histidine kinase [Desulfomonile tiedjei DSM 6799]
MNRLHVLVADDETIIRRKVCLMLEPRFQIDQAESVASVHKKPLNCYDAFVLDIMFPDGNGIDLCRAIKQSNPHSTVLISSSMETVDAWNDAFAAGADGYLEKRELLNLNPRKIALMIENLVERNRLRRQAEELNRRQAELLSVLSHDVRAPFQALLGTIELIRRTNEPSFTAEKIETLYQCAKDHLGFINSLLELLRLESGASGLRRMSLDLNLPVNQCTQSLRVLAEAKNISIETDLHLDIPKIQGDLGRIAQVLNNLLTNAIKFTPSGGTVKIVTRSHVENGIAGAYVRVADSGVGIKPEDLQKIFQRFYRGRARGTQGESGTGLGLAICKEIMQLHGGSLEAESREQHGTVITAWFPSDTVEKDCGCDYSKAKRLATGFAN